MSPALLKSVRAQVHRALCDAVCERHACLSLLTEEGTRASLQLFEYDGWFGQPREPSLEPV